MNITNRQFRRMTEHRTMIVDEVNMANNFIAGRDMYNTPIRVTVSFSEPITVIPQAGETWLVERNNSDWFLKKKSVDPTTLRATSPGDVLINGKIYGQFLQGIISSTGVITSGNGFSVNKSATGTYDITYATAFSGTPVTWATKSGAAGFVTVNPPGGADYTTAVLTDAPRGYWKFDESSGSFADSSGNSHTATPVGGIGYSPQGVSNRSITVDGGASSVTTPDHADFDTGDTFTLEAWVKNNNSAHTQVILEKGSAYRFEIDTGNNRLHLFALGQGALCLSTIAVPQDGEFHHVVATKTGTTVKLYLDGVDVSGTVTNFTVGNSASAVGIGGSFNSDPNLSLNGGIDEVAIYPTALSSGRIIAHYLAASVVSNAGCTIKTFNTAGTATDSAFHFTSREIT